LLLRWRRQLAVLLLRHLRLLTDIRVSSLLLLVRPCTLLLLLRAIDANRHGPSANTHSGRLLRLHLQGVQTGAGIGIRIDKRICLLRGVGIVGCGLLGGEQLAHHQIDSTRPLVCQCDSQYTS
jgi:hypothetical protein